VNRSNLLTPLYCKMWVHPFVFFVFFVFFVSFVVEVGAKISMKT